jgi:hypothetical protein
MFVSVERCKLLVEKNNEVYVEFSQLKGVIKTIHQNSK